MITKHDIKDWFLRGVKNGYMYLIVISDTFDYEYFPSYTYSREAALEKISSCNRKDITKVMEVYNLTEDMEAQLDTRRNWRI